MKKLLSLMLCLSLMFCFVSTKKGEVKAIKTDELVFLNLNGQKYIRTFYDEFTGTELDNTKWTKSPEWERQGGSVWDHDMTSVSGGYLKLTAKKNSQDGLVHCGAVRTRGLFDQKYGFFEARIRLQSLGGFWSAFWLMPENIDSGIDGGADGTEMDIYEAFSVRESKINHALHWDGYSSRHKSVGTQVVADVYDGQFHYFSMEWTEDYYAFFIDGVETYRLEAGQVVDGKRISISKIPSYLKLSLESGSWTGTMKDGEEDCILVDCVKVYERADYFSINKKLRGDLDIDADIDATDCLLLREFLCNKNYDLYEPNADANRDGKINAKDALTIRKYLAKVIDEI